MTASIKQDVLYEYMQQESKYISQIDDLERVIEALTIDYNNFRELYFEVKSLMSLLYQKVLLDSFIL